ncbi:cell division control protein CDC6 [Acrasis kona]|uniref:Cell division control protein CDC6 n=1 Tax=Acrasis kona TaxID=1008807 RepID=A0AAW2ZHI5_9EUKA
MFRITRSQAKALGETESEFSPLINSEPPKALSTDSSFEHSIQELLNNITQNYRYNPTLNDNRDDYLDKTFESEIENLLSKAIRNYRHITIDHDSASHTEDDFSYGSFNETSNYSDTSQTIEPSELKIQDDMFDRKSNEFQELSWSDKKNKIKRALSNVIEQTECKLFGRATQINDINNIINGCHDVGTSILISGLPGTGKTLVSKHILSDVGRNHGLYINCMSIYNSSDLYKSIQLVVECQYRYGVTDCDVIDNLNEVFKRSKKVLVLDEVECISVDDRLRLLHWTSSTKLVLIGITNQLAEADKFKHHLLFDAYNKNAIERILRERIESVTGTQYVLFNEPALKMVSIKSSLEGGLRNAFLMARKCVEMCDREEAIGLSLVNKVYQSYFTNSVMVETIKRLPLQQKLLLCAGVRLKQHNSSCSLGDMVSCLRSLAEEHRVKTDLSHEMIANNCVALGSQGMLKFTTKNGRIDMCKPIAILVSVGDLKFAMKDDNTIFFNNILDTL